MTTPADYTTLVAAKSTYGSIASWVNDGLIQNVAPTILYEAQMMIYRRLRIREMLVDNVAGTMTVGQDYISMPSDFLDAYKLMVTGTSPTISGGGKIDMRPRQEVQNDYQWDQNGARVQAQPTKFYIDFNSSPPRAKFDSAPDQLYPYFLNYYQQPSVLGSSNTTNFLTNTYPKLLRLGCMIGATEWLKQSGQGNLTTDAYQNAFEAELVRVQAESDRSMRAETDSTGPIFK